LKISKEVYMPQAATIMNVRLPFESNKRLEALAKVIHRSRDDIAAQAIEEYLDMQEYQIRAIQEAVDAADSPTAEFMEHVDVVERMKNIGRYCSISNKK
jgi:RHH-type rel operon transcriptional repressor/antitoxin RelB